MSQVSADSLRVVLDSVFTAPAYQWVEPPRPFAFLGRWWRALEDWLAAFREGNPQLFEVFFWTLVVILVLVLVHASYVMFQTIRAAGASSESRLPEPLEQRDAAWYRRRAEVLASADGYTTGLCGPFSTATRHGLFGSPLVGVHIE